MGLQLLAFPPTRLLASIASALLISWVLSEGLIALLPWLVHGFERLGPGLSSAAPMVIAWQLLTWSLAAFAAAALAASLAELRLAGWIAGGLWLVPALIIAGLVGLDGGLKATIILLLLVASLAGAGLALRIDASNGQALTQR